jgi:hypothetical protein
MNSDGTNPINITDYKDPVTIVPIFLPLFSPDGEQVAAKGKGDGGDEIYMVNTNGTNRTIASQIEQGNRGLPMRLMLLKLLHIVIM